MKDNDVFGIEEIELEHVESFYVIQITAGNELEIHEFRKEYLSLEDITPLLGRQCKSVKMLDLKGLLYACDSVKSYYEDGIDGGNVSRFLTMLVDKEAYFHSNKINRGASTINELYEECKGVIGDAVILIVEQDIRNKGQFKYRGIRDDEVFHEMFDILKIWIYDIIADEMKNIQ